MRDLLSIGQFSNLTQLTIKALRLYERIGVLRPAVVDLSSGYRYYQPEQVETAHRIALLRSLDMPLAEIRALLNETTPDALRERLLRHRAVLDARIAGYRDGLALLQTLDDWAEALRAGPGISHDAHAYECTFCGKPNTAVRRMISGGRGGLICNECVEKCVRLLSEQEHEPPESDGEA